MNFHVRERAAEKELRALRIKKPEIEPLIREYARHEVNGYRLTAQNILFLVRCYIASQWTNGFIIQAIDGKSYKGEKIREIFLDGVSAVVNGKSKFFSDFFVKDITPNEAQA